MVTTKAQLAPNANETKNDTANDPKQPLED
jgi:hypothetical protein